MQLCKAIIVLVVGTATVCATMWLWQLLRNNEWVPQSCYRRRMRQLQALQIYMYKCVCANVQLLTNGKQAIIVTYNNNYSNHK